MVAPSSAKGYYAIVATPEVQHAALPAVDQLPEDKMSVREYLRTRVTTLKPPMTKVPNPFVLLGTLNKLQWFNFLVGFAAWTWDAFDFFTVSMTLEDLAKSFGKTKTDITWGISITLMLRSIGSILFGLAADRYGRKWPFVINNLLFIVLELATGFCTTFEQFMWVRGLYGIAMGGMWGNAAATALEDAPPQARGIISGMLQQGYAMGYLLAVIFSRLLVNTTSHGWRPLFWFGACPPFVIIAFRLMLPETMAFQARKQAIRAATSSTTITTSATSHFFSEANTIFQQKWLLLCYLVLLMAAMNFMSHGSQDLYPTMLKNTLQFNANQVTATQVIANLGAITGGTLVGYYSQVFGRRLSILVMACVAGSVLYAYCFTRTMNVMIAAFFMQFCVQGAWGVIPIHLMELSPPAYSTFIAGTAYQLGNLISSTASTIEATLSEMYPLPPSPNGDTRYEYGKVIAALLAIVLSFLAALIFIGPEASGKEFAVAHDGGELDVEQNCPRDSDKYATTTTTIEQYTTTTKPM